MRGRDLALGVMAGLVLALMAGGRAPVALAQPAPAGGEAGGTIALTAPTQGGVPLLFVVDTREKALAVYRVDPQKGSLKLEASRPYRHDLKLEWNNLPPEASAVEAMVATTGRK
jgi:hypothetical protein